jgi:probable F420-dependent oxidoreductase
MEIGLNLPATNPALTAPLLRRLAERADARGYAELFLGEHVVLFGAPTSDYPASEDRQAFFNPTAPLVDPIQTLSFLAACTSRIRLGTGVVILPQRNPVYTAKHVATLDWLSGGRFDFGVGVGWAEEEYKALDMPFAQRGPRCEEFVAVMKALWTQHRSEFSGRFYELPACYQYPKPVQTPHPPLWFGGWSPPALERAARLGDGWYGFEMSAADVAGHVDTLRRLRTDLGRAERPFKVLCGCFITQPQTLDALKAYRDAGVDQFVMALTAAEPAALERQLEDFADRFIGQL